MDQNYPWEHKTISKGSYDNKSINRLRLSALSMVLDYFDDEENEVLAWVKNEYHSIKTIPDFIGHDKLKIGYPLSGYLWTKRVLAYRDAGHSTYKQAAKEN